jgi:serine/threonine protein phosphatase PrpC
MEYVIAVKTDVGRSRPTNQDSMLVRTAGWQGKNYAFAVLCDGMGGLRDGDYASRTVIRAMDSWFEKDFAGWLNSGGGEDDLRLRWEAVLESCNEELVRYGRERSIELGTTVTALLLGPERYAIVHIGDTRAYEIGNTLCQLSRDHTLAMRMVEKGEMTREEARHARENHVLTRCVGVYEGVSPEFYFGAAGTDTVYLLCSDGFRNQLREEELEEGFSPLRCRDAESLLKACEHWLRECLARGEDDNISVIAVRTLSEPQEPRKLPLAGDTVELD